MVYFSVNRSLYQLAECAVFMFVLQPYGFMESPIPYWHIEDVNVISRWDAGQRFCIRITIPDGSVLLQVSIQALASALVSAVKFQPSLCF